MKLLDTTFLIHYWAGTENAESYLKTHDEAAFVTTTLNIKELAVGVELREDVDAEDIVPTFEWVDVRPFETEHALIAGELEAALHRDEDVNRDEINALAADLLIAAVAREAGATVVTRNIEDFQRFEGLDAEAY